LPGRNTARLGYAPYTLKTYPKGNRAKKMANRPLLGPRVVFENGDLGEFG
jgi:hypothetical protein